MSVFNYLEGIPSREDVIEEDGTLIKDYMSSLEYKPTHKKHVKATLKKKHWRHRLRMMKTAFWIY